MMASTRSVRFDRRSALLAFLSPTEPLRHTYDPRGDCNEESPDANNRLDSETPAAATFDFRKPSVLFSRPARKVKNFTTIYEDTVALACPTTIPDARPIEPDNRPRSRDSRRRTIWVPSDDTTVLTIHPGMHTGTLHDETISMARLAIADDSLLHHRAPARHVTRSPLAVVKKPASNQLLGDTLGRPTGKENEVAKVDKVFDAGIDFDLPKQEPLENSPPRLIPITPGRITNDEFDISFAVPTPLTSLQDLSDMLSTIDISIGAPPLSPPAPNLSERLRSIAGPLWKAKPDQWDERQEKIMSLAVNEILSVHNLSEDALISAPGTTDLLDISEQPHITGVEGRLKESVRNGVLSLPRTSEIPRIQDDVGLRQCFLDFWLDTYDPSLVMAVVQATSGRSCKNKEADNLQDRKRLQNFLSSVLLPRIHLDGGKPKEHERIRLRAWQNTTVLSLMTIYLLDQTHYIGAMKGCLFRSESKIKSSNAALLKVSAITLPFIGDVVRILGYMGYRLSCEQRPLDEYRYRVSNLAIDLRDGIILARVLEILQSDTETALSSQLTYPCPTRLQKLQNVQVSLAPLGAVPATSEIALATSAADIVDGNRGRTLTLLWAMITSLGLRPSCVEEEIEDGY